MAQRKISQINEVSCNERESLILSVQLCQIYDLSLIAPIPIPSRDDLLILLGGGHESGRKSNNPEISLITSNNNPDRPQDRYWTIIESVSSHTGIGNCCF